MDNTSKTDHQQPVLMESGQYIKEVNSEAKSTAIIFSMNEEIGALTKALNVFQSQSVNLLHIESRPCESKYEFMVECDTSTGDLQAAMKQLMACCSNFEVISRDQLQNKDTVPWFPRKASELDCVANKVLSCGVELHADHPGFKDPVYRARKKYFTDIISNYKHYQEIPRVEYTAEEIATWGIVLKSLTKLFKTHACRTELSVSFPSTDRTGFTLRPVSGLLAPRDFLAGLAFRVFHSTQYVRHHKQPLFTPEPDICHELLGHAPLFADPVFAQFSQEIGLASLGASDEYIKKLATCYWFCVEYGICRENDEPKVFGAGLLSSFGELEYCLSGKPEFRPFEPAKTCLQKYLSTVYQSVYFISESIEDAKQKMMEFTSTNPRPFAIRYNPYTQSVEILNSKPQIHRLVQDINSDIQVLVAALDKLN